MTKKAKQAQYITIDEALNLIKTGDKIILGMAASEPQEFVNRLHEVADRGVKDVLVTNCLPVNQNAPYFADSKYYEAFEVHSWFYSPGLRRHHKSGADRKSVV